MSNNKTQLKMCLFIGRNRLLEEELERMRRGQILENITVRR